MLKRSHCLLPGGIILLATFSNGFAPVGNWMTPASSLSGSATSLSTSDDIPTPISVIENLEGKHFQLEELEDQEKCSTDVLLNSDMTLTIGQTDGPLFRSSSGTWSSYMDDSSKGSAVFEMKLSRTYVAGENQRDATDIGEFTYQVERTFNGVVTSVAGSVAVEGVIVDVDDIFGSREVGFFNMIDTTEARIADSVQ